MTNEPGPQYYDTLKDRFVRHAQVPERTKALVFVFVFVFVLAHEQAISVYVTREVALNRPEKTPAKPPNYMSLNLKYVQLSVRHAG